MENLERIYGEFICLEQYQRKSGGLNNNNKLSFFRELGNNR